MTRGLLRKGAIALAATFVIGGISAAQAETCYRLSPFSDILRLTCATKPPGGPFGSTHTNCYGNWISGSYTLPVVGARELNRGATPTSPARRLGLHGTNNTTSFSNNPICIIDGIPNAPWILACTGGPGARFTNSGSSLTSIPCGGLPPSDAEALDGATAAGE